MKKAAHRILTALVCIFALGCVYVSAALMMGAGFAFSDIDYGEAQRQAAESKAAIFSIFCFFSLCASVASLLLSGRIARLILRVIGMRDAA
jgi:hypothetical protein